MARRKRASMREGPLADLFRSTVEPDDPPEAAAASREAERARIKDEPRNEPRILPERDEAAAPAHRPAPEHRPERDEGPLYDHEAEPSRGAPPDPERVRAYRLGEPRPPTGKERVSRIFTEEPEVEGPLYGREEPGFGAAAPGEVRPHTPVIRVVGVGG